MRLSSVLQLFLTHSASLLVLPLPPSSVFHFCLFLPPSLTSLIRQLEPGNASLTVGDDKEVSYYAHSQPPHRLPPPSPFRLVPKKPPCLYVKSSSLSRPRPKKAKYLGKRLQGRGKLQRFRGVTLFGGQKARTQAPVWLKNQGKAREYFMAQLYRNG